MEAYFFYYILAKLYLCFSWDVVSWTETVVELEYGLNIVVGTGDGYSRLERLRPSPHCCHSSYCQQNNLETRVASGVLLLDRHIFIFSSCGPSIFLCLVSCLHCYPGKLLDKQKIPHTGNTKSLDVWG